MSAIESGSRPRVFVVRAVVALVATTAAMLPALGSADELSPPLSKDEVTALVVGKRVDYVRKRDGAQQGFDFKDDGSVYFATSTTMRNTTVTGSYVIEKNGAVCFKWIADKWIHLDDFCRKFRRDGDKLVLVVPSAPDTVFGEVR